MWTQVICLAKYYTGIGSRETPDDILHFMREVGVVMASAGWILRSGGADGADTAFEIGAWQGRDKPLAQIFLPWKGFNGNLSPLESPAPWTFPIAQKFHPAWGRLSSGGRLLMARNIHQCLGTNPYDPISTFLVCWTKGGKIAGGTGQALRIAGSYGIPVYNLGSEDGKDRLYQDWLGIPA